MIAVKYMIQQIPFFVLGRKVLLDFPWEQLPEICLNLLTLVYTTYELNIILPKYSWKKKFSQEFGGKNGSGTILPVFIFYPNTMK